VHLEPQTKSWNSGLEQNLEKQLKSVRWGSDYLEGHECLARRHGPGAAGYSIGRAANITYPPRGVTNQTTVTSNRAVLPPLLHRSRDHIYIYPRRESPHVPGTTAPTRRRILSDSDQAKARAEAIFKRKEQQASEAASAMTEYQAASVAIAQKIARLKTLRLAKEQAERTKKQTRSSIRD
jgi:hypothetical protein